MTELLETGFSPENPLIRPCGLDRWELREDLCYTGATDSWTVPAGTVTDFATVPKFLHGLISDTGLYLLAAILHDWFCAVGIQSGAITARDADGIFRRVMREGGVPFLKRWVIWTGVRLGAMANPVRRHEAWKDLPLVLALSILVLPVLLAPVVTTLLASLVYRIAEGFCHLVGLR